MIDWRFIEVVHYMSATIVFKTLCAYRRGDDISELIRNNDTSVFNFSIGRKIYRKIPNKTYDSFRIMGKNENIGYSDFKDFKKDLLIMELAQL